MGGVLIHINYSTHCNSQLPGSVQTAQAVAQLGCQVCQSWRSEGSLATTFPAAKSARAGGAKRVNAHAGGGAGTLDTADAYICIATDARVWLDELKILNGQPKFCTQHSIKAHGKSHPSQYNTHVEEIEQTLKLVHFHPSASTSLGSCPSRSAH
eukprot:976280-Pelagomonas_calceolata.AAC.1